MTENTTPGTKRRFSRKVIILAATTALVLVGGTATAVGVSAYGAQTRQICDAALADATAAHQVAATSQDSAASQLAAVGDTTLPDGRVGALYADRAEDPAKAATETSPAEAAHHSGQSYIDAVVAAKDDLVASGLTTDCSSRDDAASITASTETVLAKVTTLDTAVSALTLDFTVFQNTQMNALASNAANTAMAGAAQTLSDAQNAAQTALEAATNDPDGYAATEAGATLVAALQASLDASKGLDTSGTATTTEDAVLVTDAAQSATDTATALKEATAALNSSLGEHQSAKATERANAQAAADAAAKSAGSKNNSSGSSSNNKNNTGTTTKPPSTDTGSKPPVDSGGTSTNPPATTTPPNSQTPPGGVPPDKGKGGEICYNGNGGTIPCP